MEFDRNNVRGVVEDRLSSLPDELIHRILSGLDMKFAVQTCLLSSRWEFLWTSLPCLYLSSCEFDSIAKFSKFVTHVLTHRNHQVQVSAVNLEFCGDVDRVFVRKIANYAFSHNVQKLSVDSWPKRQSYHSGNYPSCLFSSQSLKHFTLNCRFSDTPKTPWNFPALTTLYLSEIGLCGDIFSKCVNLKNLVLRSFDGVDVEVFDIVAPRLSNLVLIDGLCSKFINVIAPQLENLKIYNCSIGYFNAPAGLSSLCYKGYPPLQLSKDGFHSLNKVDITLTTYQHSNILYKEEDARKNLNMLQELHSAKYLKLNVDIVECITSFPDLLIPHPSPFSNLLCLTMDSSITYGGHKVKMSNKARNFFFENSPNAIFIMDGITQGTFITEATNFLEHLYF